VHLALAYAEQDTGKGILVVDSCAEAPRLHDIFGVPNSPGLSDLLLGERSADEVTKQSILPSVRVLPAGDSVLPLALHRHTVKELIRELAAEHDVTLIDSPAVLESTTAELLASLVEGVVLVVHAQRTPRDVVAEATRRLTGARSNIIGAVFHNYHEYVPWLLRKQLSV
jgi:Mrp family chromosome partitioning ATPase